MVNVKFYLDKADKSKHFPIHLVLRQKDVQVKVATGEKVLKKDWDAKNQLVKETEYTYKSISYNTNQIRIHRLQMAQLLHCSTHLQHTRERKHAEKRSDGIVR